MFLNKLIGLFSLDMGIDLGTANTLVYVRNKGIVLAEPSYVAVKNGTREVLMNGEAVGREAKRMYRLVPPGIDVIRPLKDGVIANFEVAEAMLTYFIKKAHRRKHFISPRVLVAVPSGITAVEERAVFQAAERAGAREVFLLEEPRAAALGAGLPIHEPAANMIVDVGGGTTEVAVISIANVVESRSIRIAGDDMDDAIIQYMRRNYNIAIGENTAERIKVQIGSAYPLQEECPMTVRGLDQIAGLPRAVTVTSEEIREALKEPVHTIVEAVRATLEATPPELAADLVERGMVLAGGGSLLRGLDKLLNEETGLPVYFAEDPISCVARGTGMFLERLEEFASILKRIDDVL
ncbi:MAG TPA: rod shape-determining protein [Planctomycetota bacterium]|jgi:rod shape-determining protein MreB|nr:rod shape-determining protein [Planctomycetota bacterium]OQC22183.1 MAG: Rod shape-determining protein MreB [Planctomycetes bacterium ADurb.Bin069]NMD34391.1 rod shape-determining protein [Planctomycetota bacterium]HNR99747.1 rod shape-determining protein [Planctomycetota bacterium]HNU25366.1 rod shape-determining protein [Planctomycetota bacterium]